jgi:DNA-binding protein HU-alpha
MPVLNRFAPQTQATGSILFRSAFAQSVANHYSFEWLAHGVPVNANHSKEKPMRKPELAAAVADETGLTRDKASEVITAFTDQISAAAARGEDITLIGFGTFNVRRREARDGRNPQTGANIRIPASKTVGFKAGKSLKDSIR